MGYPNITALKEAAANAIEEAYNKGYQDGRVNDNSAYENAYIDGARDAHKAYECIVSATEEVLRDMGFSWPKEYFAINYIFAFYDASVVIDKVEKYQRDKKWCLHKHVKAAGIINGKKMYACAFCGKLFENLREDQEVVD